MTNVAIVFIGTNKYLDFLPRYYEQCEEHLMPDAHNQYFIFTDGELEGAPDNMSIYPIEHKPWPAITLERFHTILEAEKELKKFDIDFDFGTKYEKSLANILKLGKVEVKTERDKWNETRNIAIELSCNDDLSGLNTTEADYWAHILTLNDTIKGIILLPVERLKEIVKLSVHDGNGRIDIRLFRG